LKKKELFSGLRLCSAQHYCCQSTLEETMKRLALAALAIQALTYPVVAQTPQPAANSPGNSAVKSTDSPQPGSPVKGANSFTEGQAKARIEEKGFSKVSDLKKDDTGIWRGRAEKDGKTVSVSLDFQGNIFAN
jgi:hypothetical protein